MRYILKDIEEKSKLVHNGDLYSFPELDKVTRLKDKTPIKCERCGETTLRRLSSHLDGYGCRKCNNIRKGLKRRINEAEKIEELFPGIFNLDKIERKGKEVYLECKKHGPVILPLYSLLSGHNGCPGCTGGARIALTKEEFLEKAREQNNHKTIDYNDINYPVGIGGNKQSINLQCIIHGAFSQKIYTHLAGASCPSCSNNKTSQIEAEISEYISSINISVVRNDRSILDGIEIDIYIPSHNIGIEIDGVYFHTEEKGKDKQYHVTKTNLCLEKGIRLLHIFDDEWRERKEIVKARLRSIFGIDERIFARKLVLGKPSILDARNFLNKTHIQGQGAITDLIYGLYDGRELMAIMSFAKLRFQKEEEGVYELLRYSSYKTVVGGFSKLLKAFIREKKPEKIISYADRRWSVGNVYKSNGFVEMATTQPGYFWVSPSGKRESRIKFQKHRLKSILTKFDPNLSEYENCIANGYTRIFDCGHLKFEWRST